MRIFFDYDIDDHKEQAGNRIYDCDIIVRQHGLIVEYDGSHWHVGNEQADRNKTNDLRESGWHVIRVREKPLLPLSSTDVSIPSGRNMKLAADAVLRKIQEILSIRLDGLDNYLEASDRQNVRASEAFMRRSLRSIKKAEAAV